MGFLYRCVRVFSSSTNEDARRRAAEFSLSVNIFFITTIDNFYVCVDAIFFAVERSLRLLFVIFVDFVDALAAHA